MMQASGEGTKSGAFDFAFENMLAVIKNYQAVADHPDMTPELAEMLSTPNLRIEYNGYDVEVTQSRKARAETE